MQTQTQGRSDPNLRTGYEDGDVRVVLTNCRFKCQGACGRWRPASKFGALRNTGGVIRNQSRCIDCR